MRRYRPELGIDPRHTGPICAMRPPSPLPSQTTRAYDEQMSSTTAPRSTSRRRTARSKGDEREEQILSATRELLTRRPMGEVIIDEIASAAGISRTSFYFYFPSKQAVLATLMEQTWDDFTSTHEWFDSVGADRDGLRAQLIAVAEIWRANGPILACATGAGGTSADAALHDFLDRARQRYVERLAAKIERDRSLQLAPQGSPATELATLVAIMRDGRLAEVSASGDTAAAVASLADTIERMIYGRLE